MEFDKEATVPCSATGREKPTIKWERAGGYSAGIGWGQAGSSLIGYIPEGCWVPRTVPGNVEIRQAVQG